MIRHSTSVKITGSDLSDPGPGLHGLSFGYDYSYRGTGTDPIPGERSPQQIVAELHAEIAAKSPEHAALVAQFEALPPGGPGWDPVPDVRMVCSTLPERRLARFRAYAELRASGADQDEAAQQIGISKRTSNRYEAEWPGAS